MSCCTERGMKQCTTKSEWGLRNGLLKPLGTWMYQGLVFGWRIVLRGGARVPSHQQVVMEHFPKILTFSAFSECVMSRDLIFFIAVYSHFHEIWTFSWDLNIFGGFEHFHDLWKFGPFFENLTFHIHSLYSKSNEILFFAPFSKNFETGKKPELPRTSNV